MDDEPLLMKRKKRNEAEELRTNRGTLGYEQTRAEPEVIVELKRKVKLFVCANTLKRNEIADQQSSINRGENRCLINLILFFLEQSHS